MVVLYYLVMQMTFVSRQDLISMCYGYTLVSRDSDFLSDEKLFSLCKVVVLPSPQLKFPISCKVRLS